ncbi:hypothetical protein OEZ86_007431 [Tetradesmus obliquus]|nr:hypothetical protein OEZ86_007431 [Tetradesmus obliquus]
MWTLPGLWAASRDRRQPAKPTTQPTTQPKPLWHMCQQCMHSRAIVLPQSSTHRMHLQQQQRAGAIPSRQQQHLTIRAHLLLQVGAAHAQQALAGACQCTCGATLSAGWTTHCSCCSRK